MLNYKISNYIENFSNIKDNILDYKLTSVTLNCKSKIVFQNYGKILVSDIEYKLLEMLLLNKDKTLSRKEIEKGV